MKLQVASFADDEDEYSDYDDIESTIMPASTYFALDLDKDYSNILLDLPIELWHAKDVGILRYTNGKVLYYIFSYLIKHIILKQVPQRLYVF